MKKCKLQRVCNACHSIKQQQSTDLFSGLSFREKCSISSFLSPREVLSLGGVNQSTHREFTSCEFDGLYWFYQCNSLPFYSLLFQQESEEKGFHDNEETNLLIHLSSSFGMNEISDHCCIDGCYWRLHYMKTIAISRSLQSAFSLVSHHLVRFFFSLLPSSFTLHLE